MTQDKTLKNNMIHHWMFMIQEYERVKHKQHKKITSIAEFYQTYHLCGPVFLKYYHRFQQTGNPQVLLPQKRGPKYTLNPIITPQIQQDIYDLRQKGCSKTEIYFHLKAKYARSPSLSRIYQLLYKQGLNKLPPMAHFQKSMGVIMKNKAGELGHIDCHSLPLFPWTSKPMYLLGLMDDATRLVAVEVIPDKTPLTIAHTAKRLLEYFQENYHIHFTALLSDNGGEFGGGPEKKNKDTLAFEMLLKQQHIRHLYTRVQHPQCNGKIERFWRILKDEFFILSFAHQAHFQLALQRYLSHYNTSRRHSSINYHAPLGHLLTLEKKAK